MNAEFLGKLLKEHKEFSPLPSRSMICQFVDGILQLLFPQLSEQKFSDTGDLNIFIAKLSETLATLLEGLGSDLHSDKRKVQTDFLRQLPEIYETLMLDANAIAEGDPASLNINEVIRTYPGFYAIAIYRIAHFFYQQNIPYLPRILTEYAHTKTGIDINPGAIIGPSFCIDHGTGLVIGETAVVGRNVKIYQGVTLGALSVSKQMANIKRHPTIEDDVIIYSGATILGGETVVGHHSIIGGNVWLIKSVPAYSRVYHKEQINISKSNDQETLLNSLQ
jgi:serine O-acetyltransferase